MGQSSQREVKDEEKNWNVDDSHKSAAVMISDPTVEENFTAVDCMEKKVEIEDESHKLERSLLNCCRCQERFSEDNTPKNLLCGHSMCTSCAKLCLDDRKTCTECQAKQLVSKVTDFSINYPLLRIIRAVASKEVNFTGVTVPTVHVDMTSPNPNNHAGTCPRHGSPMMFMCMSCSVWVCRDCLVIDHPYLPRGSCRILDVAEAMTHIRKEYERHETLALKDIERLQKTLEPQTARHNYSLKYCTHDIRSHGRLVGFIEKEFVKFREERDPAFAQTFESIEKLNATAKETESPEEMTTTCKELIDCQEKLTEHLAKEKERMMPLVRYIASHLTMDLRLLVNTNKTLYAVRRDEIKGIRWAPLTCKDDRLVLYSLKDGSPPEDGLVIPYDFVRDLVMAEEYANIFLEIGTADEVLGRVHVKLNDYGPLTHQAIMLCTGEKGPSYKDTCFYEYDNKEFIMKGGDYENNDGTGGRPIVTGLYNWESCSEYLKVKGAFVCDPASGVRFHIHLQNINSCVESIIGWVKEGLDVLKTASKLDPVTKSFVRDCGVHIPMKTQAFDDHIPEDPEDSEESEDAEEPDKSDGE